MYLYKNPVTMYEKNSVIKKRIIVNIEAAKKTFRRELL